MGKRLFTTERLENLYMTVAESDCDVFWRHDVDYSVNAALKLANVERMYGVYSTYYIFNDSEWPFYTPEEGDRLASELCDLGHEVGFHVDERSLDADGWNGLQGLNLSFHCPTQRVLWRDFKNVRSAYERKWKGNYCADSGGSFWHGDPEDMLARKHLQINLHAEWWYEPNWKSQVSQVDYERYFYVKHPYAEEVV